MVDGPGEAVVFLIHDNLSHRFRAVVAHIIDMCAGARVGHIHLDGAAAALGEHVCFAGLGGQLVGQGLVVVGGLDLGDGQGDALALGVLGDGVPGGLVHRQGAHVGSDLHVLDLVRAADGGQGLGGDGHVGGGDAGVLSALLAGGYTDFDGGAFIRAYIIAVAAAGGEVTANCSRGGVTIGISGGLHAVGNSDGPGAVFVSDKGQTGAKVGVVGLCGEGAAGDSDNCCCCIITVRIILTISLRSDRNLTTDIRRAADIDNRFVSCSSIIVG